MKFLKNIAYATLLSALVAGCSDDFTDLPLDGIQTVENVGVFENAQGCNDYVIGTYVALNWDDWWQVQYARMVLETASDNGWLGNLAQWGNAAGGDLQVAHFQGLDGNNGNVGNYWTFNYFGVQRANYGIENISAAPIDENLKAQYIAELKFLRGWFYFELVKNWGDVPLYLEPRTAADPPIARTPKAEVYTQIMQDFRDAAAVLPQRIEYSGLDKSRASQGAALAFLAKAALWSGQYPEAEQAAQQVVDLNEYALEPDFGFIFQPEKYNGQESIFEISSSQLVGNVLGVTGGSRNDGGWGWNVPSSNLEQAFLEEGDTVRLVRTIIKHGEPVWGDPNAAVLPDGGFDAALEGNKSGRIWRKFYVPRAQRVVPDQGYASLYAPIPYILMRYAEVLLIYAEASAQQGKDAQAVEALNQVRTRAQLPPVAGLSGAALMNAIIEERRLEFAGELTYRWDDLRRVMQDGELLINKVLGPGGSFVEYNLNSTDPFETAPGHAIEPQNKGVLFTEGRNELLPIPTLEINAANGVIDQNPGY